MNKTLVSCGLGLLLALGAGNVGAVENVRINGFMTVVGATGDNAESGGNPYLNGLITDEMRFDNRDSRVGLQISADVNERMDLTAQLISRGGRRSFDVEADWAFVGYDVHDQLRVRAGKVKFPTFLVSDFIEVGYAYPWIRPPEEVYSLNPITTLSGVDLLYTPQFGPVSVLIQPYFGNNSTGDQVIPPPQTDVFFDSSGTGNPGNGGTQPVVPFDAKELMGINLSASTDAFTFRLGYLQTDVDATITGISNPAVIGALGGATSFSLNDLKAEFASAGFTMDWNNIVAYAEYATRDEEGDLQFAFPDQEAWYATLGYRIGKFLPMITYAELKEGADAPPAFPGFPASATADFARKQESITAHLRYELADGAALKAEIKQVEPETGNYGLFRRPLRPGDEEHTLYSVGLDVIF